jgi:folate-binding protein YgfZ
VVKISGGDAFRYLNGQITRDLKSLGMGEAVAACILTPKGRLCAPLLIHRGGEDLFAESLPELRESLLARLERYIVADDVTLSVETPQEKIHCFGRLADSQPSNEGILVSRLGVKGVDLPRAASNFTGVPLLDHLVTEALRIERGIPAWGQEMNAETLPPEVGLDRTHIDYDRGCYPGQETISRLKSIGRVRRLLHVLKSENAFPLSTGMMVFDEGKEEIGRISSATEQFDTGAWVALALLPRGTSGMLFARDPLTGETTPITIAEIHGT